MKAKVTYWRESDGKYLGYLNAFWKPALPDPDDEAFAQLALEAKVGYRVTHNLRHFPVDRLPALKIPSPKEFLHILQIAKP